MMRPRAALPVSARFSFLGDVRNEPFLILCAQPGAYNSWLAACQASVEKAFPAARIVSAMSSSLWAAETKAASNCAGGK